MSAVRKRSIAIRGHRTSFSVEDDFMDELAGIAARSGQSVASLVGAIDAERDADTNLSSAIRLHVLRDLQSRRSESGAAE